MIYAKCVSKIRDLQGRILGYILKDTLGNTRSVHAVELKDAIKAEKIDITNLTLTSDNRLVDRAVENKPKIDYAKLMNFVNKSRLLGICKEVEVETNKFVYVISQSSKSHTVVIPEGITYIEPNKHLKLEGEIKYIGGINLVSMNHQFAMSNCYCIDISKLDTSNITNMSYMFSDCDTIKIILGNIDTSKVEDMRGMFRRCRTTHLNLSSFDTSNVTAMHEMFANCDIDTIDLTGFNTSKVLSMRYMFRGCCTEALNLSSFEIANKADLYGMFEYCSAKSINLQSFKTSIGNNIDNMFEGYEGKVIVTDRRIIKECKKHEEITPLFIG